MLCLSTPHADCILPVRATEAPTSTLPQHAPRRMHLDVAPVSANASALPQHVLRGLHQVLRGHRVSDYALCLSTSYADCIFCQLMDNSPGNPLPQHVLRGLHPRARAIPYQVQLFASARPTRIASRCHCRYFGLQNFASARPTRIASPCPAPARRDRPVASARPTRIASAKTHKVRLAFMTDGAVSR